MIQGREAVPLLLVFGEELHQMFMPKAALSPAISTIALAQKNLITASPYSSGSSPSCTHKKVSPVPVQTHLCSQFAATYTELI